MTDHMWFSTGNSDLVPCGPFMISGRLIATAVEEHHGQSVGRARASAQWASFEALDARPQENKSGCECPSGKLSAMAWVLL